MPKSAPPMSCAAPPRPPQSVRSLPRLARRTSSSQLPAPTTLAESLPSGRHFPAPDLPSNPTTRSDQGSAVPWQHRDRSAPFRRPRLSQRHRQEWHLSSTSAMPPASHPPDRKSTRLNSSHLG